MPRAQANGIELEYEVIGEDDDPVLLLVSGLGRQLLSWDDDLVAAFVDRGVRVVRFDNRDAGRSTVLDARVDVVAGMQAALAGEPVDAPYRLSDMAADVAGLLDAALDVQAAHVVGASMGGMISQQLAVDHPSRVQSLTSIMSTTGDPDVGTPRRDVAPLLMQPPPMERDAYIEHQVEQSRVLSGAVPMDEDRVRTWAAGEVERGLHPRGTGRQLLAIMASPSRTAALRQLDVPTLVVHGTDDPLVHVSGGERTAEAVPDAELLLLEGMGHDLPTYFWGTIVERITAAGGRAS